MNGTYVHNKDDERRAWIVSILLHSLLLLIFIGLAMCSGGGALEGTKPIEEIGVDLTYGDDAMGKMSESEEKAVEEAEEQYEEEQEQMEEVQPEETPEETTPEETPSEDTQDEVMTQEDDSPTEAAKETEPTKTEPKPKEEPKEDTQEKEVTKPKTKTFPTGGGKGDDDEAGNKGTERGKETKTFNMEGGGQEGDDKTKGPDAGGEGSSFSAYGLKDWRLSEPKIPQEIKENQISGTAIVRVRVEEGSGRVFVVGFENGTSFTPSQQEWIKREIEARRAILIDQGDDSENRNVTITWRIRGK